MARRDETDLEEVVVSDRKTIELGSVMGRRKSRKRPEASVVGIPLFGLDTKYIPT